jgi:hypothetical protein
MRDEFAIATRRTIAERAGLRCSNPECQALTIGPRRSADGSINLGVAAHITAASVGGPRYDPTLTQEQRCSANNGISLCQTCAKLIDTDLERFSVAVLKSWKRNAEAKAALALGKALGQAQHADLSISEMEILRAAAAEGDIWFIRTEQGDWVRSGNMDFQDDEDPAYSAEYQDGLQRLLRRGLVVYKSGILYGLTGGGFRVARALSESQSAS